MISKKENTSPLWLRFDADLTRWTLLLQDRSIRSEIVVESLASDLIAPNRSQGSGPGFHFLQVLTGLVALPGAHQAILQQAAEKVLALGVPA